MTRPTLSLMDVIDPPGNDWLRELARRKTDLPAGVRVIRFNDDDDDAPESGTAAPAATRRPRRPAA